ncbi:hypothetical protein A7K91_03170 [Paenibacillus oryzae]|uniref:DUF3221 domain-containing protein n=1 Tax=Paenibacillus oryzae TaxID=1844972 RepID=A0A1A5YLP7_9BACL|nr:DUF3221 domain-containing protein [Paenibacillus oryzae]OBR66463.1 hypothetical protein A7K91_03170 [Paenibacillus oryzae]
MKKNSIFLVFLIAMLVVVTGCSSSSNSDERWVYDEHWDYKDGFVVSKESGRILVVRDKPSNFKAPLNEILKNAEPNAMWISVEQADYDAVAVGDRVSIEIPNGGGIDQPYPAQTTADVKKK